MTSVSYISISLVICDLRERANTKESRKKEKDKSLYNICIVFVCVCVCVYRERQKVLRAREYSRNGSSG